MKRIFLSTIVGLLVSCSHFPGQSGSRAAIPADREIERRVDSIMSRMSLDDKVGQMCEVVVDMVCADSTVAGRPVTDSALLDTIFNKYRVGSILNTAQGACPATRHVV